MRKLILLLLLIIPSIGFSQTFEGKIIYTNSYKSKSPQLKDEQLATMMGTTQEYYFNGADYKSVFNGSYIKMHMYKSKENRSYTLTAQSDSLYWEDYNKNKEVATKFEVEKGKDTVMGVLCDVLTVYTLKSKTAYYYNSKYGVNPSLFDKHAYGNWYYVLSKTKALPLKTISENEQFTLISTAVNVTRMKLAAMVFELPQDNKIAPATW